MRQLLRDQRGFSLAEILVVTAVLGLVMAAVIAIQQKGHADVHLRDEPRRGPAERARGAGHITRELRYRPAIVTLGGAST